MRPALKPLTLIVATTATHGIGRNGTLPWPSLKQEMAYFASVTKRPPNPSLNTVNAVIMGRKTWDSIPPRFRPLKDRLNVVVSRSMKGPGNGAEVETEGPVVAESLEQALEALCGMAKGGSGDNTVGEEQIGAQMAVGDVFIIGGSSIYAAALEHPQTRRILLTKILQPDYECDTFFPIDLDAEQARSEGWTKKSAEHLKSFVRVAALGVEEGEDGTRKKQGDVEWEYCMYER